MILSHILPFIFSLLINQKSNFSSHFPLPTVSIPSQSSSLPGGSQLGGQEIAHPPALLPTFLHCLPCGKDKIKEKEKIMKVAFGFKFNYYTSVFSHEKVSCKKGSLQDF